MSRLVISEKSDAAARIAAILSRGNYKRRSQNRVPIFNFEQDDEEVFVVGLRGHIVELDYPSSMNDWSKTSPHDLVYAEPEKRITAHNIIGALSDLVKDSNEVVIATDFDREGELIGLETVRLLGVEPGRIKRARFSALTKGEIDSAFSALTLPDEKLAEAAECRQIIDLAWGASLTRFISLASNQVGSNFLSVGRVQSPTLGLIVNRHKEIGEFVPKPYWNVTARFEKGSEFNGNHLRNPFWEEELANKALHNCEGAEKGKVTKFERSEKDEYAPPPFNTTMMLMEANKLGLSASRAMKIAEDLYTSGYISYPRTDNTVYPRTLYLKGVLEKLKTSDFKNEAEELLAQEQIRPSRGKVQTTDHPPIYPTEAATGKQLKGDHWKLYELVVRRFFATVAPPARSESILCHTSINEETFESKGYKLLFLGWRKYYPYFRYLEILLPDLKEGDEVNVLGTQMERRETQPPARYSQGSLIQEMEKLGLGTKSTRHDIVQKLYDRKYVEGPNLIPTPSGIAVTEALEHHAQTITESKMTSHLEKDMEDIANGKAGLGDVVEESQDMLSDVLETMERHKQQIGDDIRKALEEQRYIGKCPDCGAVLKVLRSKQGRSFVGCANYPKCKRTYPMPPAALVQPTEEVCEVCKSPRIKVIRKGQPVSIHCLSPDCETNRERLAVGTCPKCGKDLRVLYSRIGKRFIGCTGYPECDQSYPLPQKGYLKNLNEQCSECKAPVLQVKNGRTSWRFCANMECPSNQKKAAKEAAPKEKKAVKKKASSKKKTTAT